ncbi:MAG: DUF4351 domain-containing protein [Gammaproteobacteria bacterium]|nr:DUF4351 domain-containing protein [Gammaproteobacteria bacterium]
MAEPISHDQNFKNLIVDYPRDALKFFAPDEAPEPGDAVRIVPVREELLKAHLGERFRRLDVPLLAEWTDGTREAILFAVEEETDPGRFSPLRLAQYCVGLAGMFDTRRVVPVVVFLRRGAVSDTLRLGTERHDYLTFDYITCALGDMAAGDWLDSDNLVARVNLPNMRVQSDGKVDVYASAVRGLLELEPDLNRREKYIEFIDIYADLSDNERRIYRERHPKESGIMTGMFQRAREEGRAEGMQLGDIAGQQRGRMEGERKFLERLLRRKFGTLPSVVGARLSKASATDLEAWGDNVLDADSIDEVFEPH